MAWNIEDCERLRNVINAMLAMQRASWEQGVAAQALLELDRSNQPEFRTMHFVVSMAHDAVVRQEKETGRLAIVHNADPGCLDPASMVEPVLAAAQHTSDAALDAAARRQIAYLTAPSTPRTADGTLSHRTDKLQLWVDGIYMGPPALAVAGRAWDNRALLAEAVTQIRGYRAALWSTRAALFAHIWDVPSRTFERAAHWGVGNGWALAGMTRVLLMLPADMASERADVLSWILEALDGVLAHERPDHLFHDILDDPSSFVEANVAQQVAYTVFRLFQHGLLPFAYLERAEKIREAVHAKVDNRGLVRGVCGSPRFVSSGTAMEGQAFFVLMEAAHRDISARSESSSTTGSN